MSIAYFDKAVIDKTGTLNLQRGGKGMSIAFCPLSELQHPCTTACALFGEPYKATDYSSGIFEPLSFPVCLDICNGKTIAAKSFVDER